MGKGLDTHRQEVEKARNHLVNDLGADPRTLVGGKMFFDKKGKNMGNSGILFHENLRQFLNKTQALASKSPSEGLERKEYAQKGKLEIARLLKELFPKQEEQRMVLGIARKKVLETRNDEFPYPNGAYYFACPEDARRSGLDLSLLREAETMGIEIPPLRYKKVREVRELLQGKMVEKLAEKTSELIRFIQRQNVFLPTEKIISLVGKLTEEGKYEEVRELLKVTGRGEEVKKIIAEKKAPEITVKTVTTVEPRLEAKTEVPVPETLTSTPETPVPMIETPTTPTVSAVEVTTTPKRRKTK